MQTLDGEASPGEGRWGGLGVLALRQGRVYCVPCVLTCSRIGRAERSQFLRPLPSTVNWATGASKST